MIDIIYSLIFVIPLILLTGSTVVPRFVQTAELASPHAPLVVMIVVAVILTVLFNVENKIRIIVAGSLGALVIGAVLVTDAEKRADWIEANEWIWPALIIAVCAALIGLVMTRARMFRLIFTGLLAGVLISSLWTQLIDSKTAVVSIVFLCLTVTFEELRYRKRGSGQINPFVVWITPFLLAGMIGLYFMPVSEEPYDWAFAKKLIRRISDEITLIIQSFEDDSLRGMESSLGFSDEAHITGDARGEAEEMMTVSFGAGAPQYVYLDGKYFEDFDGRSWTEAEESYPYMMDTIELLCAASYVDTVVTHDFYRPIDVRVTYSGQNSRYLFTPVKTLITDTHIQDTVLSYTANEVMFDRQRGNGTGYRVISYLLNCNENTLPQLMRYGSEIDGSLWDFYCIRHNLKEEIYSYEAFQRYRDSLYDGSLCPNSISKEELPQGVREFLDGAVDGAETDYEKLVALEAAFSEFEYTLSPGALPKDVTSPADFLEYFIVEAKKGYCNSFATAFVLLCRAEGIPARYVYGYRVPNFGSVPTTVYSSMAHAYPEAYLPGVGWTVFEPTPGYSARVEWDERGRIEYAKTTHEPETVTEPEEPEEEPKEPENAFVLQWYMIVIPAALCIAVLAVIITAQRMINTRRFKRSGREERARIVCRRIMNMLSSLGIPRAGHETVREYAERVRKERGIELSGFASALEKLLYSSQTLTDDEAAALDREYEAVRAGLTGRYKVIYYLRNM